MKKAYTITLVLALIYSVFFFGCDKAAEEIVTPPPAAGEGATSSFTSNSQGSLDYDDFSLVVDKGDVPNLTTGEPGTVTFSLNTSTAIESSIPALPSGNSVIGKFLKAGPEAFNFGGPIQLYFPASGQSSPQNLEVMYYSPDIQQWRIVSASAIDTAKKRIAVDVLRLGYYVLTKRTTASDNMSDYRQGGCVFDREDLWTNYILTVKSAALEKPEQLNLFVGGYIGRTYSGPIFIGCPIGKTKAIVPQGVLEFWISKTVCQGSDPAVYTYTLPATVTVSEPLNFTGWSTYDAVTYVPFTLPAGGSWVLGRPAGTGGWPAPTVPYGSGTFQATLTWNNASGSTADLDLHLYCPNNVHIYYGNRTTADFSLDRDWQSTLGDAIENIYSLRSVMPSGTYTVKVVNYSGVTKSFNTRVILNGASTNFSGSLSSTQEATVRTFTIP